MGQSFAHTLLHPLYTAFAAVGHRRVRSNMADAVRLPVPIVSVGNIAIGGTAKTPTVEYLARALSRQGFAPGVVLRGYKGRLERESAPPQAVSDGKELLLDWEDSGDEARLLAEALLEEGMPVAVGRDRIGASRLLIDRHGVDIVILDDGFQFTKLKRDFDLALIDTLAPFGRADGRYGPLREPVSALGRADAILLTRSEAIEDTRMEEIRSHLEDRVNDLPPVLIARTEVRGITCSDSTTQVVEEDLAGRRVAAFAGIGNPLGFQHTIKSLDVDLMQLVEFRDHHPYVRRDLARVDRIARRGGAEMVLTTSKDAIRLDGRDTAFTLPLAVVDIRITIDEERRFLDLVLDCLGERGLEGATGRVAYTSRPGLI